MNNNFELPPTLQQPLRANGADLNREAKKVYPIDLFCRGVVSHCDLSQALGLDRFETNALFNRYRVTERSLSNEEVDAEVSRINDLLASPAAECRRRRLPVHRSN